MPRPTRDSIEGLRPISRNLSLDLIAAVGYGVSAALVSSLLPTIARRGGLEPLGLAALSAAPFLTNLLSVFAGRFGPRSTRRFALLRSIGAGSLVVLAFVPGTAVIIAVVFVFWISVSFGSPFQLRLWGASYPARIRGRVVGFLGTGRAASAAIAALVGGLLADRLGGSTAVALAGLVGAACALAYAGFRATAAAAPLAYSARESIRALRARPTLQRVALAQGFFGGGFIAAGPLFALIYVDRLDLSLSDVGVIGVLGAAATTVSFLAWGAVADRSDALAAMRWGSIVGLGGLLAYVVAPGVAFLWIGAVAIGVSSSSIEVGGRWRHQRADATRLARGRDERLECDHRGARTRRAVRHERTGPVRRGERHGRVVVVRGGVGDRRRPLLVGGAPGPVGGWPHRRAVTLGMASAPRSVATMWPCA